MATITRKAIEGYNLLFEELPDPRTKDWLFVAKPYQVIIILVLYLMFVLKWGPNWMKNRPAFDLEKVLIVYNAAQVVACTYLFNQALYYAWGWNYKWVCEPVDFSNTHHAMRIAYFCYYYYLLKLIDLLDTVFFVLRKKKNHLSFLHLYHHTGMVLLVWGGVTYLPGGHGTFIGVINSFVHAVMYFYYLLTVIKPSYKQSFWWKKHITQLQIIQFFWCVVHMGNIVFRPECAYPRWTSAVFLPQNLFMLVLFIDFYIKTYVRKPTIKTEINNSINPTEYSDNKVHNLSCENYNKNINNDYINNNIFKFKGDYDNKSSEIVNRFLNRNNKGQS